MLLVERGYFESREKAKAAIMAREILVDGEMQDKAGVQVSSDAEITVKNKLKYVGRGGLKLEKAMKEFDISVEDKVCMDIGASTGGFTDCMLQSGARKVYAIDVGYGQLDYKLRTDKRVINLEKTNIRYLDPEVIDEKPEFASIDVSFISVELVLPVLAEHLLSGGHVVILVKPQFEAGREQVGKNGIVRDAGVHKAVIEKVAACGAALGFAPKGLTYSPITGAKGNIEYLLDMEFIGGDAAVANTADILAGFAEKADNVVKQSHENLKQQA